MAGNDKKILQGIANLNKISKATNAQTYGMEKDMSKILANDVDDFITRVNTNSDSDKALVNSHIAPVKAAKKEDLDGGIYDIIKNSNLIESLQSLLGAQNMKFSQTLKDYEIIKRCIPQVHKVITTLRNNILSPDSISKSSIGIKMPASVTKEEREKLLNIVDKYKLNDLLSDIVMDYLIVSAKYITVVPYSQIVDMLSMDKDKSIEECISILDQQLKSNVKPLLEAAGDNDMVSFINESTSILDIKDDQKKAFTEEMLPAYRHALNDIEFVDGGLSYFKNAILNEAINTLNQDKNEEKTMRSIVKKLTNKSKKDKTNVAVNEGLIANDVAEDIRKNVDFKGCHIENLDCTRIIPFKMRNTVVGYFYVEDKVDVRTLNTQSSIMDKINSSIYAKNVPEDRANRIETMVVKTITDKLIKSVNSKFLNDNFEDMDIIYEFVRENELHKKSKRVIFFQPDDVCEFRREDGSIMKNAMFMAKLYILTILTNVITNVTRGSDRQIYYVKTGLSTDIEGHVNKAIRAIKQSQVRYSDIGTINDVFNVVGSNVDVFMPTSIDGEKPIETEVISGQKVDMNDDFIQFLIKSIILSFGVPSVTIDQMDQVELAKTLSMSNLDIARTTLDAQLEITPVLTKLIQNIARYEMPEYDNIDDLEASLNAPTAIILEMNRDLIDSIQQTSDLLAALIFPPQDENPFDKRIRLFKLEYFKRNTPTLDWDLIEQIKKEVEFNAKEEEQKTAIGTKTDSNTESNIDETQPADNGNYGNF